jgi:hypothetical protein
VLLATTVVKDFFRDQQKDLVSSFEATQHVWLVISRLAQERNNLLSIESELKTIKDTLEPTKLESPTAAAEHSISIHEEDISRFELELDNLVENRNLLMNRLPKRIRKELDELTKSLDSGAANLRADLKEARISDVLLKTRIEAGFSTEDYDAQISALWRRTFLLRSAYATEVAHVDSEFQKVLRLFGAESASATRRLRTFTYWTWCVLYPVGLLIGILGQLAGVKVPGGE